MINFVNEGFRFVLIFVSLGPIRRFSLRYFAKMLLCRSKLKGIAPSLSVFYPDKFGKFVGILRTTAWIRIKIRKKFAESIKP
jgi:hypothetical protein